VSGVGRASVQYPGGLAARSRWGGSGSAAEVFALSESGGVLHDLGSLVSATPDRLCRAELRVEGPLAAWTVRFASAVYDEPAGLFWDSAALLVVKYGFGLYALAGRSGALAWWHLGGTPLVAVVGSPRLPHVLAQGEVETLALDPTGSVVWRVGHPDVVAAADLMGGTLVLTSYDGTVSALDPLTGQRRST
jgi:outer membrane protein assembly factor BamB